MRITISENADINMVNAIENARLNAKADAIDGAAGQSSYQKNSYEIASTTAYLAGVYEGLFYDETKTLVSGIYEKLSQNKNARIVRNLSIVRTSTEINFGKIFAKRSIEFCNIYAMDDFIPGKMLSELRSDGIVFSGKAATNPCELVNMVNTLLSDRINNCMGLYPEWVNKQYIRSLFVFPIGQNNVALFEMAQKYYANRGHYPFQCFLNLAHPEYIEGNMFHCDNKFLSILYAQNNDTFEDRSKVTDVSSDTRENIYAFFESSTRIGLLVDCENSSPLAICAALDSLSQEERDKISQILFVDDEHTTIFWDGIAKRLDAPIKHIIVDRVMESKSRVDMSLAMAASRAYYEGQFDSFIICSSDSDYWSLVQGLPGARFLFMVEHGKTGKDIQRVFAENEISYCFIDEFNSSSTNDMQNAILKNYVIDLLNSALPNLNDLLAKTLHVARLSLDEAMKTQFFNTYLRQLEVAVSPDGQISLSSRGMRK